MTSHAPPTADQQLEFLNHLQRLFEEGDFTSTYKYALLLALAELAVERGDDSGAPLELSLRSIAEKFAVFYWSQTAPYVTGRGDGASGVLFQNQGQQAAIIRHLSELRLHAPTLPLARQHPAWNRTLNAIARVIRDMPVRYLQNLAGSTVVFLFEPNLVRDALHLLPGVACHMRRFQGFLQRLARAGWIEHVRNNNRNLPIVGPAADLERFMFGTPRASLAGVANALRPLQNDCCFFCRERLSHSVTVDHFIPWSRYPRDTALNFVLTHAACNADKRELLAATPHVERWIERNRRGHDAIRELLEPLGFLCEEEGTARVAQWAYSQAVHFGASLWVGRGQTVPVSSDVLKLFATG